MQRRGFMNWWNFTSNCPDSDHLQYSLLFLSVHIFLYSINYKVFKTQRVINNFFEKQTFTKHTLYVMFSLTVINLKSTIFNLPRNKFYWIFFPQTSFYASHITILSPQFNGLKKSFQINYKRHKTCRQKSYMRTF